MRAEFIGTYTRPTGYFGQRCTVRLCACEGHILEVYPHGYHTSPYLPMTVADANEAAWLVQNHPNGQYYQPTEETT